MDRVRTNRFSPRLETLDDRLVPSCTWVESGSTLTITGSHGANVVEIIDDGTALTITCDGETVAVSPEVTDVLLKLGNGNDTVTYELTGDLAVDAVRSIRAQLGNGNDTFTATLGGSLLDGADLDLVASGQNGRDWFTVNAEGVDVGTDATLDIALLGGNATDVFDVAYAGILLGDLDLYAFGGNGRDIFVADITAEATSTGSVEADLFGGNGPDRLTFTAADNSGDDGDPATDDVSTLASWSALADGGRGPSYFNVTDDLVETVGASKGNNW